jgi:hypothetical protein
MSTLYGQKILCNFLDINQAQLGYSSRASLQFAMVCAKTADKGVILGKGASRGNATMHLKFYKLDIVLLLEQLILTDSIEAIKDLGN